MENSELISELLKNERFADLYNHLSHYDKPRFEHDINNAIFATFLAAKEKYKQRWPAKGDKLVVIRNNIIHWYKNIIENCAKLEIGQTYTVKECNVASSWCEILLEELEGQFCLSAFNWKVYSVYD